MSEELTEFESDPCSLFIYAFNSLSTKEKSVPRLNKFSEFGGLIGTLQENCATFAKNVTDHPSFHGTKCARVALATTPLCLSQ